MPLLIYLCRRRFIWLATLSCCVNLFWIPGALAQSPAEYQVKAVFIYNFTHFVKWPAETFKEAGSPFTIGVVGQNIGTYLEETIESETIDDHPLVIKYIHDPKEAVNCHILFIEKQQLPLYHKLLEGLSGKPVLTVSDADNFMEESGIIRLYNVNNKIRMEINQKRSEESKLEISTKLLSLATRYNK